MAKRNWWCYCDKCKAWRKHLGKNFLKAVLEQDKHEAK